MLLMISIPRMSFIISGSILLIWGLIVLSMSNYHIGHFLTILLACIIIGSAYFYDHLLLLINESPWSTLIKYLILFAVVIEVSLSVFLFYVGQIHTTTMDEDAIIILGAGLQGHRVSLTLSRRLDQGLLYLEKNPKALIVVSGGQGFQETRSEASAMSEYLQQRGVLAQQIIEEDQSTSTYENFLFSKKVLKHRLPSPYNVVYITNDFHAYRAGYIAKKIGFNAHRYSSSLDWYMIPSSYLRETLAVYKTWFLGH